MSGRPTEPGQRSRAMLQATGHTDPDNGHAVSDRGTLPAWAQWPMPKVTDVELDQDVSIHISNRD